MCLIFFSIGKHPRYKLIMAGNRDEFYDRKTAPADFWPDSPEILGGRDLEAMGTWLGVTRNGKISMLTNFRDPKNINPSAPSRGKLVSDYLISSLSPGEYMRDIAGMGGAYNGFNLLAGTPQEMWYYSNYGGKPSKLEPGYFGISNHLLDTPWPKVLKGKEKLKRFFVSEEPEPDTIFDLLYDADTAPVELLPDTGLTREREIALSSMFIKTSGYGSRCSTIVLVDRHDHLTFIERVYDLTSFTFTIHRFSFFIQPKSERALT
jgi:uncharacterized protein with NRDE domain